METKITIHKCFRCHYENHFKNVPYYINGKKCKRCHVFNYFNSHTIIIRQRHNPNNVNNKKPKKQNTIRTTQQTNRLENNHNNRANNLLIPPQIPQINRI